MVNHLTEAWVIDDYGSAEDLRMSQRETPSLGKGDLLVSVAACSLNPLDLKLISGVMRDFMPVNFPFTPGSDVCGRVVECGESVIGFKVGDAVVAMTPSSGGMARLVILSSDGATARISELSDAAIFAALPEAGMTALAVLREAGAVDGKTVAVIGATGGVGLFICQLAKRAGAKVIATSAGEEDAALVRANGAESVIDYSGADPLELLAKLHPNGVDVVIDLINQSDALLAIAAAVKAGGRLVSTLLGPDPSAFPSGMNAYYVRLAPSADDLARLVGLVESGDLVPTISRRFNFAEADKAYIALRDGHVRGKIVVEVAK